MITLSPTNKGYALHMIALEMLKRLRGSGRTLKVTNIYFYFFGTVKTLKTTWIDPGEGLGDQGTTPPLFFNVRFVSKHSTPSALSQPVHLSAASFPGVTRTQVRLLYVGELLPQMNPFSKAFQSWHGTYMPTCWWWYHHQPPNPKANQPWSRVITHAFLAPPLFFQLTWPRFPQGGHFFTKKARFCKSTSTSTSPNFPVSKSSTAVCTV